ncbi:MAG: UvrD-helicase domain-containing protein [Nitrospiria bacterium]
MPMIPIDQEMRDRATTTFDRNVVVISGAGTGKTSLLISRLVNLLIREPGAIKVTEIVALTFTNKAANEMKARLREALDALLQSEAGTETALLTGHYPLLTKEEIDRRARLALRQMERSEIGTIHHFATTLLRRYPIEAGVDPKFQVDEGGTQWESLFNECWKDWLEAELTLGSRRKGPWKAVLQDMTLEELESLARALSSETIDLLRFVEKGFSETETVKSIPRPIQNWLKTLVQGTDNLMRNYPKSRKIEEMTRAAGAVFSMFLRDGGIEEGVLEEEKKLLASGKKAGRVKDWEETDFKEASRLIKMAQNLIKVDEAAIALRLTLLNPFVQRFHQKTIQKGLVSFDALLIKARDLLRDHPSVREALKTRYRAILIDELQDTDPVQYEILLYLSEQPGKMATHWQDVSLVPGKLFMVGDPKQSIYGFRRADIQAYHVVQELILKQGGIECRLTTNFRSHIGILDVVNGLCKKLLSFKEGRQPEYIPIDPASETDPTIHEKKEELPFRQVALRLVKNKDAEPNSEQARQIEGEALAKWLVESVIGKTLIHDRDGTPRTVRKADIAILMRTLTGVHHYLEPLRRWGIDYVVEGERHFYRSQEVIDAVNLLRVVVNPTDRIAFVGLLRSPLGGQSDDDIVTLHEENLLDYQLASDQDHALKPVLRELYDLLRRLHEEVFHLPVGEAVARIFDETPMMLLAAASIRGEQAVANLEKIKKEAERLGMEPGGTLREVIASFEKGVLEEVDEAESPLAEEGIDALKLFSVHKAKGLEFPVVVLAGCHVGTDVRERERVAIRRDWSTALVGFRIGDIWDLPAVYLAEKTRLREIEEEKRILYVAMTRAREHLTISGTLKERTKNGSFLSFFEEGIGKLTSDLNGRLMMEEDVQRISVGKGLLSKNIVMAAGRQRQKQLEKGSMDPQVNWTSVSELWKTRKEKYEAILRQPVFLTPTALKKLDEEPLGRLSPQEEASPSGERAMRIGQLAHLFLESWDFSSELDQNSQILREKLSAFLETVSIAEPIGREAVLEELQTIFQTFFHSPTYAEIAQADIVGREVPFLISWEGRVMEGIIDLIYEKKGDLFIAEYKTDHIGKKDLSLVADRYRHQLQIYPEAVRQSLGKEVRGMCLIFLRSGKAIWDVQNRRGHSFEGRKPGMEPE